MSTPGRDPSETAPFSSPLNVPWAFYGDLSESAIAKVALGDQDEWETQLWAASELLWAMTGRRWRGRAAEPRTLAVRSVRPRPSAGLSWAWHRTWGECRCWAWGSFEGGWPSPAIEYTGRHVETRAVMLPEPDVASVTAVLLDGQPFSGWRWDGRWLRRTDGRSWPVCDDSMEVVYTYGDPPPRAGVKFAAELAVDYARYAVGDDKCRLPSRITSLTRQQVTMTFASPEEVAKSRLTGIPAIDSWITSVNPYLRPAEAAVISPDVPTARS